MMKTQIMRKKIQLLILLFGTILTIKAQERNFGDSANPVPSAASFTTFANMPVSLATGVPDISIPLFSLPTSKKNISIPIGLRYHINNAGIEVTATEVGLGWLLAKGGVISRGIGGELDEKYDDVTKPGYKLNKFDDTYFYNLPGISGKFQFVRDTITNTFTLNNLTENHIKIDYVRTSNTATLILSSFKITDESGIQYVFEDYSVALRDYHNNYKSAFYLSKILDENNIEVVKFTYQKNTKYSGSLLMYQNCILTKISSNFGSVDFANTYDSSWETNGNSDPYQIDSVSLSDNSGRVISKYKFIYTSLEGNGIINSGNARRILHQIHRLDKDLRISGEHRFIYNQQLYPAPVQPLCSSVFFPSTQNPLYGALEEIGYPEGGRTKYTFEPNTVYANTTVNEHQYDDANNYELKYPSIQRYVDNPINFDTNTARNYTFQVDVPRAVFLSIEIADYYRDQYHLTIHDDPETYVYKITYKLKKDGVVLSNGTACNAFTTKYNLLPGTYTLELTGFGFGTLEKTIIQTDPPPYVFSNLKASGVEHARIREISYSDQNGDVKKRINYVYNLFSDAMASSGSVLNANDSSTILYKNVKEVYGDSASNLGYTKYYFKTPSDYMTGSIQQSNLYYSYYNLTKEGLLDKKEVYNAQNQMISSESMAYVMEEIAGTPEYTVGYFGKSKLAWLKSQKTISKTFFSNGSSLENSSEVLYNPSNYEVMYKKETAADGNITEQTIKYPADVPNSKLLAAHMLNPPLQTEIKINGSVTSKAETKYDDASTLFPTSVTSYEMQNQTAKTKIIFSRYDGYGNLIESRTPNGIPTTTIYGYNNTKPIATIQGAAYADISALSVVQTAITASNTAAPENESAVRTALENLRVSNDLKDYNITTYTWDVLTGMTGMTAPNGAVERYEYDRQSRLWKVWNKEGKLLKEYKYNYKQ